MMGLEDRDWYREEPSKAWRDQRYAPPRPLASTRQAPGGRARRWAELGLIAAAVTTAVTLVGGRLGLLAPLGGQTTVAPPFFADAARSARPPTTPHPDSKTVRLDIVPGLDAPATVVGRWSITDPRFGRIAVIVPVGRTPREAIIVELAARGYQVVPAVGVQPSQPEGRPESTEAAY